MDAPADEHVADDAPRAPCTYCGEVIQAAARKCRFCGEWLDDAMRQHVRARGDARADVPVVLKVWGGLVMAFAGLIVVLNLAQTVYMAFRFLPSFGPTVLLSMAFGLTFTLVICLVIARLGWGLWRGQKTAVIGLGVVGALLALFPLWMIADRGNPTEGLVMLAVLSLVFGPPTVIGVARWRRLT